MDKYSKETVNRNFSTDESDSLKPLLLDHFIQEIMESLAKPKNPEKPDESLGRKRTLKEAGVLFSRKILELIFAMGTFADMHDISFDEEETSNADERNVGEFYVSLFLKLKSVKKQKCFYIM